MESPTASGAYVRQEEGNGSRRGVENRADIFRALTKVCPKLLAVQSLKFSSGHIYDFIISCFYVFTPYYSSLYGALKSKNHINPESKQEKAVHGENRLKIDRRMRR